MGEAWSQGKARFPQGQEKREWQSNEELGEFVDHGSSTGGL